MDGAAERGPISVQDKDLAEGAGQTAPLSANENFEHRPHLIRALRACGHDILATQLWLAQRYPQSKALRAIVADGVARLAAERS